MKSHRRSTLESIAAFVTGILARPKTAQARELDVAAPWQPEGRLVGVHVDRDSESLRFDMDHFVQSRPLAEFPALAAALPEATCAYEITEDGVFWPELRLAIAMSTLKADAGSRKSIISYGGNRIYLRHSEWDLTTPRTLEHAGAETTVTFRHGAFKIRRKDDIVVRRIDAYRELAFADSGTLAGYQITPEGLRFPALSDDVVVPFPEAHREGFATNPDFADCLHFPVAIRSESAA